MENYNMDSSKRVMINTTKEMIINSPAVGVNRIPLEREALESGRTTSIVEYFAGAPFKRQSHPLGEEIFVLDGMFSDENGDYPAGTWIRSPHLSTHFPYVEEETIIFVKTGHLFFNRI